MTIVEKINTAYNEAVKSRDIQRRDTLKLVKSAFLTLDKAAGKKPTEPDYMNAIFKMAKNLKDNAITYPSMAENNLAEAAIIDEFIPRQLDDTGIALLVMEVLGETKLEPIKKNMGAIVKATVAASCGQTDGKMVSSYLNKIL
jgi:uncharacterized protein YqeY